MTKKHSADAESLRNLDEDIFAFIEAGVEQPDTDEKFNELALRLFSYQFDANIPYQRYCQKRGALPGKIDSWAEIPAVPSDAFKEVTLCTFTPDQATKVFMSSGTSDQTRRAKAYLDEMGVRYTGTSYASMSDGYIFPDERKRRALMMTPPPQTAPNSAIVWGMFKCIENHTIGEPQYFMTRDGFDVPGFVGGLKQAEAEGEPVVIMAPTFGLVHFFDACRDKDLSFKLPAGSVICDGGGYKGRSREVPKAEIFELAQQILGVEPECMINTLGMTELCAAYPDNVFRNHVKGVREPRYKPNLAWTRTVVVDPETLEALPHGEQGLLRHYCLANITTVLAVQTDDLGYEIGNGFEVIGRAKGAEARGCSIAFDEILSAQKG